MTVYFQGVAIFVQFSQSVSQSCPSVCNPMDSSMPRFPVHHQLPELAQTQAHPLTIFLVDTCWHLNLNLHFHFPRLYKSHSEQMTTPAHVPNNPVSVDYFHLLILRHYKKVTKNVPPSAG